MDFKRYLPFAIALVVPAFIFFEGLNLLYKIEDTYEVACGGHAGACSNISGTVETLQGVITFAAIMSFFGAAFIWDAWKKASDRNSN